MGALISTTVLYPLNTCKTKFQAELQTQQAAHKYSVEDREVASCTVASLLCSQIKLSKAYFRRSVHDNRQARLPRSLHWNPLRSGHCENLVLRCTKNLSWEGTLPYASAENDTGIIKGCNAR